MKSPAPLLCCFFAFFILTGFFLTLFGCAEFYGSCVLYKITNADNATYDVSNKTCYTCIKWKRNSGGGSSCVLYRNYTCFDVDITYFINMGNSNTTCHESTATRDDSTTTIEDARKYGMRQFPPTATLYISKSSGTCTHVGVTTMAIFGIVILSIIALFLLLGPCVICTHTRINKETTQL